MCTNGCKYGVEVTSHLKHDNRGREQTARLDVKWMLKNSVDSSHWRVCGCVEGAY